MLSKIKVSSGGSLTGRAAPGTLAPPVSGAPSSTMPTSLPSISTAASTPAIIVPASSSTPAVASSPVPTVTVSVSLQRYEIVFSELHLYKTCHQPPSFGADRYGQAASNLLEGNSFQQAVQEILDVGRDTWDRDTVVRALHAAFSNPERAVEYLYSGIPKQAEAASPVARTTSIALTCNSQAEPASAAFRSYEHIANPVDIFPQLLGGGQPTVHPCCRFFSDRWYELWKHFVLAWAVYSCLFTPLEFGFFRGLPRNLFWLNCVCQIVFFVDIVIELCISYWNNRTNFSIAHRCLKIWFIVDFLGCIPWDLLYRKLVFEGVRCMLLIRLFRWGNLHHFFERLEKDIRFNYSFIRIFKLVLVMLYSSHLAGCIFYYLSTIVSPSREGYAWMGSLPLGNYHFAHSRDISLWRRYISSLYFAFVTMTTGGYGDTHPVSPLEMGLCIIFMLIGMGMLAYLLGNFCVLMHTGSRTRALRNNLAKLKVYMDRYNFWKLDQRKIEEHLVFRHLTDSILTDIPVPICAQISKSLHTYCIRAVPLFKGCSEKFLNDIVSRLQEEFFVEGEVIMKNGEMGDHLYFICEGVLEHVGTGIAEDWLKPNNSFGEIGILRDTLQLSTIHVIEPCILLQIKKESIKEILEHYPADKRQIFKNLEKIEEEKVRDTISSAPVKVRGKRRSKLKSLFSKCSRRNAKINTLA